MGFWRNITTGKDNTTHDIMRVAITIVTFTFPALILWGLFMLTVSFFLNRPFDLMSAYEAFGLIIGAFGTFLMQGGGSLFFKKTTEPDGTQITTESITSGQRQQQVAGQVINNIVSEKTTVKEGS
jgi:hypothetical protein